MVEATADWTDEVAEALAAPFPEKDVQWVIVATKNKDKPDHIDCWAPYLDADAIRDRLDEVCGPGGWAIDIEAAGDYAMICRLTILGVTRADVGEVDEKKRKDSDQPLKAAATDALKRAAVNFGIGRYLHKVSKQWRKPEAGPPRGNAQGGQRSGPPKARPNPPQDTARASERTNGLTPGQQAFQDIMKAHDLTLGKACDLLKANIGATPQEALWNHIRGLMERKGCDEDTAYKAATDELSAAVASATLSS